MTTMPFKPGEDKNRNKKGRPKGSENRSNKEIRDALRAFIDHNMDDLQKDWKQLEPYQKWTLFERILKHVLPAPLHPIDQLSEDDLHKMISVPPIKWVE